MKPKYKPQICSKCGKASSRLTKKKCDYCYKAYKQSLAPLIECQCLDPNCKVLIPSLDLNGNPRRFVKGHGSKKDPNIKFTKCSICKEYKRTYYKDRCLKCYEKTRDWTLAKSKYKRTSTNGYYIIFKPHYPYCDKYTGYVLEHRYIMYLYLSILNNKVTYIEDLHVHHINKNTLDNRIQNLQLLIQSEHSKITCKDMKENNRYRVKDMSNRFCNICKIKEHKNRKWCNDINGFLCIDCLEMIRHYRKKFGFSTSGY